MGLLLFYLFLALSVSFLCSVMEAVLLTTPTSFLSMKEEQGVRAASLFKKLKKILTGLFLQYCRSIQ